MAAMGEMLENIAHQWRQPLSTISICTSGMELKKNLNLLEDKDFYDSINHIKTSISYLSNTIEDFRSFLDKDKVPSEININHLMHISELPDSDAGVVPDTFAMRFSRV